MARNILGGSSCHYIQNPESDWSNQEECTHRKSRIFKRKLGSNN